MDKLIKGNLASQTEIAQKVNEIVEWINDKKSIAQKERIDEAFELVKATAEWCYAQEKKD